MTQPLLRLSNATPLLAGRALLEAVDLELFSGTIQVLKGPNGVGKTSLFRSILGLQAFTGSIEVAEGAKGAFAYVPQLAPFDPKTPVTCEDFLGLPLSGWVPYWLYRDRARRTRIQAALETVRLVEKAGRPLGVLSGGERQRLLFAQAWLKEAKVWLLDEPTQGLDAPGREVLADLLGPHLEAGGAVLAISHDEAWNQDLGAEARELKAADS